MLGNQDAVRSPSALDADNVDDLVGRAAYRTKADVEQLVASLRPRVAPRDGIRAVAQRERRGGPSPGSAPLVLAAGTAQRLQPESVVAAEVPSPTSTSAATAPRTGPMMPLPCDGPAPATSAAVQAASKCASPNVAASPSRRSAELRPVSSEEWSLRVTLDASLKADLETLTNLLAHRTRGDLTAVLREAVRCAIERHGKRKGSLKPSRERGHSRRAADVQARERHRSVPMAVRREVWERDGGACTWTSPDGKRCGSQWMLELDHVRPVALGGDSTVRNLTLRCRGHNLLAAEEMFGRAHMGRFRRAEGLRPPGSGPGGEAREPARVRSLILG